MSHPLLNIMVIVLLVTSVGNHARRPRWTAAPVLAIPTLIFLGESNVGAECPNTDLSSGQKAVRSALQILNNNTLLLESLHISRESAGGNNLLDHAGLIDSDTFGWESQLCTQVEAGTWDGVGANPIYLLKSGQGGSQAGSWLTGGTYYTKLTNRWSALVSGMANINRTPNPVVWISLGLNDMLASADAAQWKADMLTIFSQLRTTTGFPNMPIMLTNFGGTHTTYNTKISEIASLPHNYMVDASSLATYEGLHWTTASTNTIADLFAALTTPLF